MYKVDRYSVVKSPFSFFLHLACCCVYCCSCSGSSSDGDSNKPETFQYILALLPAVGNKRDAQGQTGTGQGMHMDG